jgi:hypothetical protein
MPSDVLAQHEAVIEVSGDVYFLYENRTFCVLNYLELVTTNTLTTRFNTATEFT